MRRAARILGTLMIVAGVLTLGWAVLVWRWQDPFTALYTHWQQGKLADSYKHLVSDYRPAPLRTNLAAERRTIRREATAFRHAATLGPPIAGEDTVLDGQGLVVCVRHAAAISGGRIA